MTAAVRARLRPRPRRKWRLAVPVLVYVLGEPVKAATTESLLIVGATALLGSFERFVGILTEHYAGAFPAWLAPVQVMVASVSEKSGPEAGSSGSGLPAAMSSILRAASSTQ